MTDKKKEYILTTETLMEKLKDIPEKDRYNEHIAETVGRYPSHTIRVLKRLMNDKRLKKKTVTIENIQRQVYIILDVQEDKPIGTIGEKNAG